MSDVDEVLLDDDAADLLLAELGDALAGEITDAHLEAAVNAFWVARTDALIAEVEEHLDAGQRASLRGVTAERQHLYRLDALSVSLTVDSVDRRVAGRIEGDWPERAMARRGRIVASARARRQRLLPSDPAERPGISRGRARRRASCPHGMDVALTGRSARPLTRRRSTVLAASDPERARREAITRAGAAEGAAQIALLTVAAEASIRVGTISDALTLFRRAADLAERHSDEEAGPLRVRFAAMLAASGDSELALRTLDAAEPLLGANAWLAWYQRGLILHWAGRSEDALVWLRRAEPEAERRR